MHFTASFPAKEISQEIACCCKPIKKQLSSFSRWRFIGNQSILRISIYAISNQYIHSLSIFHAVFNFQVPIAASAKRNKYNSKTIESSPTIEKHSFLREEASLV